MRERRFEIVTKKDEMYVRVFDGIKISIILLLYKEKVINDDWKSSRS